MAAPVNFQAALRQTERPWPRRRLQGFVVLCFVAQVLFILIFGERRVVALKPAAFSTGIHLVSDPWSMEQLAAFSELSDPSVFALPSLEGFSRAGWLTYKPPVDEFAEEPQAPGWLQLDSQSLGRNLAAFLATNTIPPLRIADASLPEPIALQPRPSTELQFPKSELRIAGGLAQRRLLTPLELPSWPHTAVLTNSVVQLLVDADGTPFSTALISGSGSREADNYAIAAAKRLRFKPERAASEPRPSGSGVARESITSGTAHFNWHTLPPGAATNIFSPGLVP